MLIKPFLFLISLHFTGAVVFAVPVIQGVIPVQCGAILEAEFSQNFETHLYSISVAAGDKIAVEVKSIGQTPNAALVILGPTGLPIPIDNVNLITPSPNPTLVTPKLSARGTYRIIVANTALYGNGEKFPNNSYMGGIGPYTLSVSCTLREGTQINPGEISPNRNVNFLTVPIPSSLSQALSQLQCGQGVLAEFTNDSQIHTYSLNIQPGSQTYFTVTATPFGDSKTLKLDMVILDPGGTSVTHAQGPVENPSLTTPPLSVRGEYRIIVANGSLWNTGQPVPGRPGGVGYYSIGVTCSMDGQLVTPDPNTILTALNSGNIVSNPIVSGTPVSGTLAPTGGEILGYTLDANAGDTLALSFTRLSGNLNLGLVVLSADNKVVFQASLVTSSELTTKFTLPSAGQYTTGVFRIDLLPPAAPEATAFQVTATLNP